MRVDLYLNYPGTCEEAFRFYAAQLHGTLGPFARHEMAPNPNIPADWERKVMHAQLQLGNLVLMGSDVPAAQPTRSAYVTLTLDTVEEAERVYTVLGEGGEIFMKMAETVFATRFAMLRDRFGISWMLLQGVRQS